MALGTGVLATDVDVVEIQEISTVGAFGAAEAIGLAPSGGGARAALHRRQSIGRQPVRQPGNALGFLDPQAAQQVRGAAGAVQVDPRPRTALAAAVHGFAGQGAAVCHLHRRPGRGSLMRRGRDHRRGADRLPKSRTDLTYPELVRREPSSPSPTRGSRWTTWGRRIPAGTRRADRDRQRRALVHRGPRRAGQAVHAGQHRRRDRSDGGHRRLRPHRVGLFNVILVDRRRPGLGVPVRPVRAEQDVGCRLPAALPATTPSRCWRSRPSATTPDTARTSVTSPG